jgi:L-asparaginase
VISGKDLTTEAAVTKMMILLGSELSRDRIESLLSKSICGEMS